MSEPSTYIKLDRNIMTWGWYTDANTVRLFIHIILKANIKECKFLGVAVKRGQLVTSYPSLAKELNLSIQSIRTALNHLKLTGEVTVKNYPKFSLISVVNYDRYQDKLTGKSTGKQQATNRQPTGNQQQSKNIKNDKNGKNIYMPPPALREWEKSIPERFRGRFETERDWKIFTGEEVGDDE
jgi:hypothetical protein